MEQLRDRLERALDRAFVALRDADGPPLLGAAMRYAVFPGGSRSRPLLCLATAECLGEDKPILSDAAASALELIHCASLVHDDLPCFDDAQVRRGRATTHVAFGEPIGVLTGDALIAMAFETIARAGADHPARAGKLTLCLARAMGHPMGITAGQAWESEPHVAVFAYHKAKTAALFEAAFELGAIAAGDPKPERYRVLGELLGRAYQLADDVGDMVGNTAALGKPAGNDDRHGRPNAAREIGIQSARAEAERLVARAIAEVPTSPRSGDLRQVVTLVGERLLALGQTQREGRVA